MLDIPFDVIDAVLRGDPTGWLPGWDGGHGHVTLDTTLLGRPVSTAAVVSIGDEDCMAGRVRVAVAWQEAQRRPRLPGFDGWVEATALPRRQTRLSLHATCRPRPGKIRSLLDRIITGELGGPLVASLTLAVAARVAATAAARQPAAT